MKTKIRQTSFSPRGNILGLIGAAQLQRRSTDAVMIPADVLTTHFGIHWGCAATASEFRRCNQISPTLLSLLTHRSGWRQKVIMPLSTFMLLSWWCPLGQSKGQLPAREDIIMDRLIPILTHLSSHWTVPLSQKYSPRSSCVRTVTSDPDLEAEVRFPPRLVLDG